MADIIAFNRGVPPAESFPKEQLIESARNVISNEGNQILQYGNPLGYEPLREWISNRFNGTPAQVIMGQGSLQLLDIFIKTSLAAGDMVFFEQPTYDRTLTLFRRAGMELKGFTLRNGMMDGDEIEETLRNGIVPKAFYVIPDFQNPSGAEMPLELRKRLIRLAEEFRFLIIEDGAYRHLRYYGQNLPRLIDLNPEHVIHMSSFSKMISPGMRVGFMVAGIEIINRLGKYAEDSFISTNFLNQAIIYDFIQRGLMEDHILFLKDLYQERLKSILFALENHISKSGTWIEPKGGFFTGVNLKQGFKQPDANMLTEKNIVLMASHGFFIEGGDDFIRLPFCALTPAQINEGIKRLAELIN